MESSRDIQRRRAAKRRAAAKRRRALLRLTCAGLILILAVLLSFLLLFDPVSPVVSYLTVEAGSTLTPEMFLREEAKTDGKDIAFATDISAVNTSVPGEYALALTVDGKQYKSLLTIADRTPPTAKVVDAYTEVGVLPEAAGLVTDIQDVSEVTVSWQVQPDVSKGGTATGRIKLTDAYGNFSTLEVTLTVDQDTVPPVIDGAQDWEVFVGDPIAYKAGITVTDDKSQNPKLAVDNSQVDTEKAGTYPVTYTATDDAGNSTSVTVNLTLVDKPEGYVEPEVVYDLAQKVLDEITTEDMTQMEVAFAIYRWTTTHIGYVGTSDKSSWTGAAYVAFTERSGDCYNYFAAAKAMYEVAGIENVDVVKSDTSHSSHYWSLINLGDGWYHVDCTPRRNVGYFFMNTDAELEAYSVQNRNSHIFDSSLYPPRATESLQERVDYQNGKILP